MSDVKNSDVDRYIRAKEAAEFLGIKVGTFYNYVSRGKIPKHRMEGTKRTYKYLKSDLIAIMGGLKNGRSN